MPLTACELSYVIPANFDDHVEIHGQLIIVNKTDEAFDLAHRDVCRDLEGLSQKVEAAEKIGVGFSLQGAVLTPTSPGPPSKVSTLSPNYTAYVGPELNNGPNTVLLAGPDHAELVLVWDDVANSMFEPWRTDAADRTRRPGRPTYIVFVDELTDHRRLKVEAVTDCAAANKLDIHDLIPECR